MEFLCLNDLEEAEAGGFGTMEKVKRYLAVCLISAFMAAMCTTNVFAASWNANYKYWSQNQSDYAGVRDCGCWIVAMARMLYETGIETSSSFNPDRFAEWEVANGRIANYNHVGQYGDGGEAPVIYASQKGKTLTYFGNNWEVSSNQFWFNINAGYWTIVKVVSGGGYHYILIDNETSKATGQLYIYESSSDGYYTGPRPLSDYGSWVGSYVYKYDTVKTGYLDVNGQLDGSNVNNLGTFGTCDVYVNGMLDANDVSDYYKELTAGASYRIEDIRTKDGYSYEGLAGAALTGTVPKGGTVDVRLKYSSCKLDVNGYLDGIVSGDLGSYGTFDVYINGTLAADDVNDYCELLRKGSSYEITDIRATDGHAFEGIQSGSLSGTVGAGRKVVSLSFYVLGELSADWIEVDVLPRNITEEECEIEYKYAASKVARTSPGEGWTKKAGSETIKYENSGGVYDSDFELITSNTRVYVGSYYYHYCGAATGVNVEHYNDGTHTDYHSAGDVNQFYVGDGPWKDDNDPRYIAYKIKWKDGQWKDGWATCAAGRSAIWYRRYQYQDRVAVTYYTWEKQTDWQAEKDESLTPSKIRYRLRDAQAPVINMVKVTEVKEDGYNIRVDASDNIGILKVVFVSWTDMETQDNPVIREVNVNGEMPEEGINIKISVSDHGNGRDTWYHTDIYVYDVAGNTAAYAGDTAQADGSRADAYIPILIRSSRKAYLAPGILRIEESAFEGDISLGEIVLPDGVTYIGDGAFADNGRLCAVYLPDSVTQIGEDVFADCGNVVLLCESDNAAAAYARAHGLPYLTGGYNYFYM